MPMMNTAHVYLICMRRHGNLLRQVPRKYSVNYMYTYRVVKGGNATPTHGERPGVEADRSSRRRAPLSDALVWMAVSASGRYAQRGSDRWVGPAVGA